MRSTPQYRTKRHNSEGVDLDCIFNLFTTPLWVFIKTYLIFGACVALFIGNLANAQDAADINRMHFESIEGLINTAPVDGRKDAQDFLADATRANNVLDIARAKFLIGRSYGAQSSYENALKWQFEALETIAPNEAPDLYLRILRETAALYNNSFDLTNTYKYDVLSLQHAERYGQDLAIAGVKQGLAITLTNNDLYEPAIELFDQILDDPSLSNREQLLALGALGVAYWGAGEDELSIKAYKRATAMLTETSTDRDWIAVHETYNRTLVEMGRFDEAAEMIPEGLARTKRNGDNTKRCYFLINDVRIRAGQDKPQEAIERFQEYQPLCDAELGSYKVRARVEVDALPTVIAAYQEVGDVKNANILMARLIERQAEHFENVRSSRVEIERIRLDSEIATAEVKYLEQQDALNNAIITRQRLLFLVVGLAALFLLFTVCLFGYGYIMKSRSNSLLEDNARKNRDRARTAEKEVEYRDLLIQEINHRVKNNIQSIISILNIYRRQIGSTATEATIGILNDVSNRFHTLAAYQHSLEIVDGAEETSVKVLITDLANKLLVTSSSKINLSFDIDDINIPSSKAAPLALIVNELISNSLKHGLSKRGGKLSVTLKHRDEHIYMTCVDDGLGLPDNFDAKESLGVTIIKSLTRKLNGNLEFHKLNKGTEVRIDFPITRSL